MNSQKAPEFAILMASVPMKNKYDLNLKTPENTLNICLRILQLFTQIDASENLENFVTYRNQKDRPFSLKNADRRFLYYILSTSNQEFHESYMRFYKILTHRNDLSINEDTFEFIINLLCRREIIGKHKILKCFQKLMPAAFFRGFQLDELFDRNYKDNIGPNMLKEMFNAFKSNNNNREAVIDYLKFFPFAMVIFSEEIKKKISKREETLGSVSGVDETGHKCEFYNKSLLTEFESFGFKYTERRKSFLTIQDIEKVLLLFRNSCSRDFSFAQIKLFLEEIQKKYKYNDKLLGFEKSPKLDEKFLEYLAYVICMHSSCNRLGKTKGEGRSPVIQEYIFWNAAMNANKKLSEGFIRHNFTNFASKRVVDYDCPEKQLKEMTENYLKKIIPSIQKQSLANIINSLFVNYEDLGEDKISYIADNLYDSIIDEGENKLLTYIKSTYEIFHKDENPMLPPRQPLTEITQNLDSHSKSIAASKTQKSRNVIKEEDAENIPVDLNSELSKNCSKDPIRYPNDNALNISKENIEASVQEDEKPDLLQKKTRSIVSEQRCSKMEECPEERSLREISLSGGTKRRTLPEKIQVRPEVKEVKPFSMHALNVMEHFLDKYSFKKHAEQEPQLPHAEKITATQRENLNSSSILKREPSLNSYILEERKKWIEEEQGPGPLRPLENLETELGDLGAIDFDSLVFLKRKIKHTSPEPAKRYYCDNKTCNLM